MKLKLKPPGTKRLKLYYDEPLSTSAFNFNLRRYKTAIAGEITVGPVTLVKAYADIYGWGEIDEPSEMTWAGEFFATIEIDNPFPGFTVKFDTVVGRCRLAVSKPRFESAYGFSA